MIWKPIDSLLVNITNVYYSPVGLLNNVPFYAIQIKNNKKVISLSDKYNLNQLTSTRYLAMGLKEKEKEIIAPEITLIGGVNFDYLPGDDLVKNNMAKNNGNKKRSIDNSSTLEYLPGTLLEVQKININLQKKGWSSNLIKSDSATEENFKNKISKLPTSIIHIATHGFAFPNQIDSKKISSKNNVFKNRYALNPMVRCGLMFTGANWSWMGYDSIVYKAMNEDGILTGYEIAQLNLRKTKLVVLSACETGLGKILGNEGSFSLQRAFKLAGVDQLIVSLWQVPDEQTMELMTTFYDELSKTKLVVSSFANAQRILKQRYPNDASAWGAFVLIR